MKVLTAHLRPLFLYILSTLGLLLYLYGFFPIEKYVQNVEFKLHERHNIGKQTATKEVFQKLVLMIIDALRIDFVLPENGKEFMSFMTSSVLRNESCLIKLKAEAPTVTMPRLKAMTSGINPTYFDVVLNFMSHESITDNFLQQAIDKNLKIVFYGDDTWLKLFPNAFIRSEGTNSFFVSDYTEVDNNVTRHLNEEFRKNDWDFMILHYLGLDHIGHTEGPKSPLVKMKLKEMDSIIFRISEYLKKQEEYGQKTMLIVTSDHGMKVSGGHGGVTFPEIILPLVSIGKPCNYLPGWPTDYLAQQIDVASSVSVAFGLPIPRHNVGKLIPQLLNGMNSEYILRALEMNKIELKNRSEELKKDDILDETSNVLQDWISGQKEDQVLFKKVVESYFYQLSRLSENLCKVFEFKLLALISCVVVMWGVLFTFITFGALKILHPMKITQYFLLLGTCLSSISLVSTSMIEEEHQIWYFFWVTLCILAMLETFNLHELNFSQNVKTVLPWLAVIVCHRFLRKLNQTGDKWVMLPDLKGFLNSTENQTLLLLVYLSGLIVLFWYALNEGCKENQLVTFGMALIFSLCYRLSVSSFNLDFLTFYPKSRGYWECQFFWILTAIFGLQTAWNKTPIYLVWSLGMCIVFKPHNIMLLPLEIMFSRQIKGFYKNDEDLTWSSIAHLWLGNVFYFYQGNSNNIASIDVAVGFVGLKEYKPIYSAILVAAHTNSGLILGFLLSPRSSLAVSFFRVIPLTLYCTFLLFQLRHLFIWSVFSPKLLYEANFTIIFLILMCLNYFTIKIKQSVNGKSEIIDA